MSDDFLFSPWVHWGTRLSIPERDGPGVYLLGRFEEHPPTTVDVHDERVLLVAETHDQSLEARWKQFQYSAFSGGSGHAGGLRFFNLFNNGTDSAVPPWLYVSAVSTRGESDVAECNKRLKNRLLDEYQERCGVLPRCNARNGATEGVPNAKKSPVSDPPTRTPVSIPEQPVIEDPPVKFSPWTRWNDRGGLTGMKCAGVYALACFDGEVPQVVDLLDERIVYIGETCDNDLTGRLRQFNRSAFQGKDGHSGGWSFSSRCPNAGEKLYVSVYSVDSLKEPLRSAFIRYTERRLLWEYAKRSGHRPICNSK